MSTGGEPHVLDRAGAGPQIGIREGGPAQHPQRRGPAIARDNDADRCFTQPLELEVEQSIGPVRGEVLGLREPGPVGQVGGLVPRLG